jgi:hypothetical protein|tara:strand:- start:85 stop:732 length:648 start_codon:yes stop_codon:yes gene_type:complete
MANEFNYRNYLKNNPLLTEAKKDEEVKEEYKKDMDEGYKKDMEEEMKTDKKSSKMKLSEFKAQIKERILAEMSDDLDEADAVSFRRQNSPSYTMDADGGPVNPQPHKAGKSTVEEEMEDMDEEMKDIDEAEEVDVEDNEDINIDIEKEVDIDDESEESKIEVDSELAGESSDVTAILGLLTKAQEKAEGMGDEKLLDQIGNTITYYTRAHVVKSN